MGTTGHEPRLARWGTLTLRWLAGLALPVVLACGAIAVALQVTPMQTVTVAGQVIEVGATAPSLSLSGPGEIDLFGQSLPTNIQFTGPVRPRLQLSQISINSELTTFVEGTKATGAQRILGARLADGWKRYFAWETAVAGAGTLILVGALAGWRRVPHRTTVKLLAAGLLGPQVHNGVRLPPQLAQAERASRASVIIVSVGADDLNWAAVLRYCSVTPNCNDRATQAYFQQQLASFSNDYLDLLSRLAAL